jgi:hypothetical protein
VKLEKRNPAVWKLYLALLTAEDVIRSGTAWHGATWSAATEGEKREAAERCEALIRRLHEALARIPASELASWDEHRELVRRGLIERD